MTAAGLELRALYLFGGDPQQTRDCARRSQRPPLPFALRQRLSLSSRAPGRFPARELIPGSAAAAAPALGASAAVMPAWRRRGCCASCMPDTGPGALPPPASAWPTSAVTSTARLRGSPRCSVDASGADLVNHRRLQRRDSPGARSGAVPRRFRWCSGALPAGPSDHGPGAESDPVCPGSEAGRPRQAGASWSGTRRWLAACWAGAVCCCSPIKAGSRLGWRPGLRARSESQHAAWSVGGLHAGRPPGAGRDQ